MDVEKFNALPRPPRMPSGRISNEWHFDLRFIQIDPPYHLLFLMQPGSGLVHSEKLPLDGEKLMAFFPETGRDAAPEIAKALLRAFSTSFAIAGKPPLAPWKLTTDDVDLVSAVAEEFKKLGVLKVLWKIPVSPLNMRMAYVAFDDFFKSLKRQLGLNRMDSVAFQTPQSVGFHNFTPPPAVLDPGDTIIDKTIAYAQKRINCRPQDMSESYDSSAMHETIMKEARIIHDQLRSKPENVLKSEADSGNAEAALDYGLRLSIGCGCSPNRALARRYLILAALNTNAPPLLRATAHCALTEWYTDCKEDFRSRYLQAAAWHANESIKLVPERSAPRALFLAQNIMIPQSEGPGGAADLRLQYKEIWGALGKRDVQVKREQVKMDQKRMTRPNRYRCATVGCGIAADSGSMLSRCSGKCDSDKKPYYCSKEYDWKNHKPFCQPGAPCSVIDVGDTDSLPSMVGGSTRNGAFQVPVQMPGGKTTTFSSSTMSPDSLKEVRDHLANQYPASGSSGRSGWMPTFGHCETWEHTFGIGGTVETELEEID
ncbi:uncharacterized protein EV420DRAFT_1258778 [Desarmillaria tabescens]|uniref:MYND-type domain-containing protein n=1 Tax=Armillaria tabescens TaxID=1929756 RepID=A0AA39NQZ6_ARMTA|nr:uncharacterized protein EV420DRAFT_1258778 [Desarmillaria tabescens]KAK0469913.1 hypothetical protein EV420DRAFT_1258778 [Desarmillaria tabescens]